MMAEPIAHFHFDDWVSFHVTERSGCFPYIDEKDHMWKTIFAQNPLPQREGNVKVLSSDRSKHVKIAKSLFITAELCPKRVNIHLWSSTNIEQK